MRPASALSTRALTSFHRRLGLGVGVFPSHCNRACALSKAILGHRQRAGAPPLSLRANLALFPMFQPCLSGCLPMTETAAKFTEWILVVFRQRFPNFSGLFPMMPSARDTLSICGGLTVSFARNAGMMKHPTVLPREHRSFCDAAPAKPTYRSRLIPSCSPATWLCLFGFGELTS